MAVDRCYLCEMDIPLGTSYYNVGETYYCTDCYQTRKSEVEDKRNADYEQGERMQKQDGETVDGAGDFVGNYLRDVERLEEYGIENRTKREPSCSCNQGETVKFVKISSCATSSYVGLFVLDSSNRVWRYSFDIPKWLMLKSPKLVKCQSIKGEDHEEK